MELEITSSLNELPKARRFVREFCLRYGHAQLTDKDIWELELAVHEAVVNIIRHAYGNQMGRRILIEARKKEGQFMFRLNHWGETFDPKSVPRPTFDGKSEEGYGLFIMRRLVDELTYAHDEQGKSMVCLIKRRSVSMTESVRKESPGGC